MNYLRELMKDYKNEVKEILAADKTLAMEIQVCGVLVSNPLTHLKDRCVSIVVFEASKLIIAVPRLHQWSSRVSCLLSSLVAPLCGQS